MVQMYGSRLNFEVKRAWTGAMSGWVTHREVLFLQPFCRFLTLMLSKKFRLRIYFYYLHMQAMKRLVLTR